MCREKMFRIQDTDLAGLNRWPARSSCLGKACSEMYQSSLAAQAASYSARQKMGAGLSPAGRREIYVRRMILPKRSLTISLSITAVRPPRITR